MWTRNQEEAKLYGALIPENIIKLAELDAIWIQVISPFKRKLFSMDQYAAYQTLINWTQIHAVKLH